MAPEPTRLHCAHLASVEWLGEASRKHRAEDTVVEIGGGAAVGGGRFLMVAGPCSVESEGQILAIAREAKLAGAGALRGGAFKMRTSPRAFSGLGAEALSMLLRAKADTGLPLVSEVTDASQLPLFGDVDVLQVGARNMQNFALLRELGKTGKPVLLKRGPGCTIAEWLMSAEYVMSGGNGRVILCERGIRSFETATRFTLDLSAIPVVKELSHLPVVVDPSHATGIAAYVEPMALAAAAAGADGIMIEVHDNPAAALCDGRQSITPEAFRALAAKALAIREAAGKWS